jgi:hypothetical protein
MFSYEIVPTYIAKMADKETLSMAITELQSDTHGEVTGIRAEIATLENEVKFAADRLADIERVNQGNKRIDELKARERELAAEFEKLEQEHFLCESFIRAKVNLLEEKINSKFRLARFKLFETQINGALNEVCEVVYNGVPYNSLNNAARINIGLDIINTLSDYYNFSAPIFCDNAEAVTQLIETRGQLIRLVVSEPDKTLRIVVEKNK